MVSLIQIFNFGLFIVLLALIFKNRSWEDQQIVVVSAGVILILLIYITFMV